MVGRVNGARSPSLALPRFPVLGGLVCCAVACGSRVVPRGSPSLALLGLSGWAYFVPVPSLGGFAQFPAPLDAAPSGRSSGAGLFSSFAQFPAPLWGAPGLFFGSVPVGILRPRSDTLGTTCTGPTEEHRSLRAEIPAHPLPQPCACTRRMVQPRPRRLTTAPGGRPRRGAGNCAPTSDPHGKSTPGWGTQARAKATRSRLRGPEGGSAGGDDHAWTYGVPGPLPAQFRATCGGFHV